MTEAQRGKWHVTELCNGDLMIAHDNVTPMLLTVTDSGMLALKDMMRLNKDGSIEQPKTVSLRLVSATLT